jgi:hypothetical protein
MLLDDICGYLAENDCGTEGEDLFKSDLPEMPDAAIAVFEYRGQAPIRTSGGVAAEQPRFQIEVRDSDYEAGRLKIEGIKQLLDGLADQSLNDTRYVWIAALDEPFVLRRDEQGRTIFACNFEVLKERTAL